MHNGNIGEILGDRFKGIKRQQTSLQQVQGYLDEAFGKDSITAVLEKNKLVLQTASSAVAGQLWQRQTAVMEAIQTIAPELATPKLHIKPR